MHVVCTVTTVHWVVNVCRLFLNNLVAVQFGGPLLKNISFILRFKIVAVALLIILARN